MQKPLWQRAVLSSSSILLVSPVQCNTNVPLKLDCHCEDPAVAGDEAIQLDRHGALRAPRDDKV